MGMQMDVLLSPTEYEHCEPAKFAGSVCVVFDVLRATSVIVTGLANGARVLRVAIRNARHARVAPPCDIIGSINLVVAAIVA